jgi:hypothetical protein
MGASYALDLRERVVAAFHAGMSRLETARLFQVADHRCSGGLGYTGRRAAQRAGRWVSATLCLASRHRHKDQAVCVALDLEGRQKPHQLPQDAIRRRTITLRQGARQFRVRLCDPLHRRVEF